MFGLVLYVFVITLMSYLSPRWLIFNEAESKSTNAQPNEQDLPQANVHAEQTARTTELSEYAARELAKMLAALMNEHSFYQQNDLALDDIAKQLGISRHQTSELLNVHIGESFYDYVNRHRIEHACKLLTQHTAKLPVLQIAFESGFNNKNSFYKSFKAAKGCTPSEYRKRAAFDHNAPQQLTVLATSSQ